MKKLTLILFLFLLVLPATYAISGTITYTNNPSSVIAGQQFSILSQVQLTSFNQNECSSSGCIIELDPWTYNGNPINYINMDGLLIQSIIPLGTYSTSFCDGNSYYAGVLTPFAISNYYQATFSPKAPIQAGVWTYKINVYSGCKGNLLLSSSPISIQVSSSSTAETNDVNVFCLSSNKKSCLSTLNNCDSGETKYSTLQSCSNNIVKCLISEGCGTPEQIFQPNFKLSNLKHIKSSDIPFSVWTLSGASQNDLYNALAGLGQIFGVDITNVGNTASEATLEAYYISKDNHPFIDNQINALGSSNILLFSTYLTKEGIEQIGLETCKGEKGARYKIGSIYPSVSKTFWFYVPYPKSGNTLANSDNYNSEKQYLLFANLIDDCSNKKVYDALGGTVNGFRISSNQPTIDNGVPTINANNTPIDANARQVTITKDKISKLTSNELVKSSCSDSNMCQSDAVCQTLDSLAQEGTITPTLAQQRADETQKFFENTFAVAGGVAGAFGGIISGTSVLALSTTTSSACLASFPICASILAIGGALVGGTITQKVVSWFDFGSKKDLTKLGYCVPKEEISGFSFTSLVNSIGKSLNNAFGGKAKTSLTDTQMGYILLGVILFFIVIAVTRK